MELDFHATQLQYLDEQRNLDWEWSGPSLPLSPSAENTPGFWWLSQIPVLKAKICNPLPLFFLSFISLISSLSCAPIPPLTHLSNCPTKTHILGSILIVGFSRHDIHTVPHTLMQRESAPQGEEGPGSKCLMLWLQGDCDCSQRQKQMCLSQIQLVPFLLHMQRRRDTANDKQSLLQCTSTILGQYSLNRVTIAFHIYSCLMC